MTIQWTGFPDPVDAVSGDIIVGLAGGTANARFNASSFLFAADNLSDVASSQTAINNISPLGTKGDLMWFNGTNNAALAVGSTGYILAVGASSAIDWIANPGLLIANNLSDLASVSSALVNLGLDPSSSVTFDAITSTTSVSGATLVAGTSSTAPSFISTGLNVLSHVGGLTAFSGGGQGSALALTHAINQVTTVAASGDSVKLPAAVAGNSVVVINAAASNPLNCFPASGGYINALAVNTALSIVANTTVIFFCAVTGTWNSIVTA